MKQKVFIDGQEGTTGLKIRERFEGRDDIELLYIEDCSRKDAAERKKLINASDYTFLCLPDDAARESVSLAENPHIKIIDASTAHRTDLGWAYGLPELSKEHRRKIAGSKRVAVPGCYASGFISLVYPLLQAGIVAAHQPVSCHAVSGYSGAGRKAIEAYESPEKGKGLFAPRLYALTLNHKHLNEMQKISGLAYKPLFTPMVDDYFAGMVVSVPLIIRSLYKRTSAMQIWETMAAHYRGQNFVKVLPFAGEDALDNGFMPANALEGRNDMEIFVFGNEEQVLLCARLDNLGKGASGAAVQCMNIMMGMDERTGLI